MSCYHFPKNWDEKKREARGRAKALWLYRVYTFFTQLFTYNHHDIILLPCIITKRNEHSTLFGRSGGVTPPEKSSVFLAVNTTKSDTAQLIVTLERSNLISGVRFCSSRQILQIIVA